MHPCMKVGGCVEVCVGAVGGVGSCVRVPLGAYLWEGLALRAELFQARSA